MLLRRIARPMLAAAFVGQGIDALRNAKLAADTARPILESLQKLPDPAGPNVRANAETVAKATAAAQIVGGVLLATGKMPRLASAALAATVLPASLGAHMFWNEVDPVHKAAKRRDLLTDISLLGGLVIATADTAGRPSLGWRGRRAAARLTDTVAAALPSDGDSGLADRVGRSLQEGLSARVDPWRELAAVVAETRPPILEAALEQGTAAVGKAGPVLEAARERSAELVQAALAQGDELATGALKRARAWRHQAGTNESG